MQPLGGRSFRECITGIISGQLRAFEGIIIFLNLLLLFTYTFLYSFILEAYSTLYNIIFLELLLA